MVAHALYQLGDGQLAAGDGPAAARSFAASLAALEPFAWTFPPDHPRRARIEWVLSELRAGRLPRAAFPPPEQDTTSLNSPPLPAAMEYPPAASSSHSNRSFTSTFLSRRAAPAADPADP
eukprot:tig00020801_g13929.t1